ncbi:MAG: phosphoenolpyruvate--protein phosphotransferase [Hyphomicrobiaceae bacterium]
MPNVDAGPRVLIRNLRRIMADPGDAQMRLDRIVQQIARIMVAEVSSIYVRRRDGSFELFATEGLNPGAVHNTHMQQGEGLVGLIGESARPVALDDAQSHPSFSFRPETGEEIFQSFLGVPVLRSGQVLGVLTIQNEAPRQYTDDEAEAMQTTAMVLAELLASNELLREQDDGARSRVSVVAGTTLVDGLAMGHVVLHRPRVVIRKLLADHPHEEEERLDAAVVQLREAIDAMLERREISRAGEHREILETYRMFAHDRGWIGRMHETIRNGLTAEAAVERVRNDQRARMLRNSSPYWRERFRDLDDLSDRLLRALVGDEQTSASVALPNDGILVARSMGPAELLDYDRSRIRGLIIEDGGPNSHVTVVARALGITAIGQARGIVDAVETGDDIMLDGDSGEIHVRPTPEVIEAFADKVRFRATRQQLYQQLRDVPAATTDGDRISLSINAGLLVDLPHLEQSGADGIGLFRTELEFMVSSSFPRRERQTAIYRKIFEAAGDHPVTFRSLDIGGDKVLPYLRHVEEPNPAIGWRSIRIALDRPGLLRSQLRALLHAGAGRDLRVMLPMVSDIAEYERARELLEREQALLAARGHDGPTSVKLGAMIEVPALLWHLDALFEVADFVSVGSNDLLQFMFAADRGNQRVSNRFDPVSMPVLRVLKEIVTAGRKHDVPVTLCGEFAGTTIGAMTLIGLGYRALSVAPANVGPVKTMILSLDAGRTRQVFNTLLASDTRDVRAAVEEYARQNGVNLAGDPSVDPDETDDDDTILRAAGE